MDGGAGNDELTGSSGNDTYYYVSGHDIINDSSGSEVLRIAPGITLADITFERHASIALASGVIVVDANNTITIEGQTGTSSGYVIETLIFDDNTTVNLVSQQWKTYGTSGNDTIGGVGSNISMQDDIIYGLDGNDTISGGSGNDYLDGGAGDDTLEGSAGNDTYYYSSGHDIIKDSSISTDTIRIAPGITLADVTFERHASGQLASGVIVIDNNNSITIEGMTNNSTPTSSKH